MSTQTSQEQEAIAKQWFESGRCPKDFIHPQGGIYTEILALMEDFIRMHCQNEVSFENLDSSVNYIRLNLRKQPEKPPAPDPIDLRNGVVARKWLKERCPRHLINEKGTMGKEFATKMSDYIRSQYQDQWTLDTLDAAAKYLQLRNELPDARTKTDHSEEAKNQKLISVGASVLSGLVNHAHKQEEKPSQSTTSFSSFVNGFLENMKAVNNKNGERPKTTEAPLRRIPLDARPQDLKKYSAAEIRFWMQRKRAGR